MSQNETIHLELTLGHRGHGDWRWTISRRVEATTITVEGVSGTETGGSPRNKSPREYDITTETKKKENNLVLLFNTKWPQGVQRNNQPATQSFPVMCFVHFAVLTSIGGYPACNLCQPSTRFTFVCPSFVFHLSLLHELVAMSGNNI